MIPHFEIFFTVSYGLSRDQLEDLNFRIKNSDSFSYDEIKEVILLSAFINDFHSSHVQDPGLLAYTCKFFFGLPHPNVMLSRESLLLTEIFGAGFTKAPGSKVILAFSPFTEIWLSCGFKVL
jgi:DNA ligase 4